MIDVILPATEQNRKFLASQDLLFDETKNGLKLTFMDVQEAWDMGVAYGKFTSGK